MAQVRCNCCWAEFDESKLTNVNCPHDACPDCLRALFANYPARCCVPISLTPELVKILGEDTVERYIQKRREQEAGTKLYCSRPRCSAFVPPERIFDNLATCPSCRHFTCANCRQGYHSDQPCSTDHEAEAAQGLVKENGWKSCYRCGYTVEKTFGCNHIHCICGSEFCYECGGVWKNCNCPYYTEPPDDDVPTGDDEAREFMALMEETTQDILGTGDLVRIRHYLGRLQLAQQESEDHPDWWQPFIDNVLGAQISRNSVG